MSIRTDHIFTSRLIHCQRFNVLHQGLFEKKKIDIVFEQSLFTFFPVCLRAIPLISQREVGNIVPTKNS